MLQSYRKLTPWKKFLRWVELAAFVVALATIANFVRSCLPKKPSIELHAGISFDKVYLDKFDNIETYDSKWDFSKGAPPNIRDLGKPRYFGLHPFIWLRVLNKGEQPATVRGVAGDLKFGSYYGSVTTFTRYRPVDLSRLESFPVFLNQQQEVIVVLEFPWPTSEDFKGRIERLHNDSIYSADIITEAYLEKTGNHVIGLTSEAYGMLLGDYLVADLRNQVHGDSTTKGQLELRVYLASGEFFDTSIKLPLHR